MIPSELLLSAYASGWFPMAVDGGEIRWFSPDPRGIIPLDTFHTPRRLARVIRKGVFRIEIDRAFESVMRACAEAERDADDPGTWISDEIVRSYSALHEHGVAHSVERSSCRGRAICACWTQACGGTAPSASAPYPDR
jgi:leucyl/phenylalanyl-tRNA--protein transferase